MKMKMRSLAGPGRRIPYIGPVPEEEIQCQVACRKIPSEEWRAAHPVGIECDPPTDADMVVQVVVLGSYAYPSRLNPPANWPRGFFPVAELSCTPYLTWRQAGDIDIARQKGEDVSAPPTDRGTAVQLAGATEPAACATCGDARHATDAHGLPDPPGSPDPVLDTA
jgi:hypothetical protein